MGSTRIHPLDSIVVATGNAALVTLLATIATYALSRWKPAASDNLFFWTITDWMAPPAALLPSLFLRPAGYFGEGEGARGIDDARVVPGEVRQTDRLRSGRDDRVLEADAADAAAVRRIDREDAGAPIRASPAFPSWSARTQAVPAFDTMDLMVENRLPPISLEAAAGYMERWALAVHRLIRERRATPMETRLRRFAALMASASEIGWSGALDDEDAAVRARWTAARRSELGEEPDARSGTSPC